MSEDLLAVPHANGGSLTALSVDRSYGYSERDFLSAGVGEGFVRHFHEAGALTTLVDGRLRSTFQVSSEAAADLLLIRATLRSDCRYVAGNEREWAFDRPAVSVAVIPRGTRFDVHVEPSEQRTLTVLMSADALRRCCGLDAEELPAPLHEFAAGRVDRARTLLTLAMPSDIASLMQDLLYSRLQGPLRRLQLQSRAGELLALVLAAWQDHDAGGRWVGARAREAELLAAARRILCEQFANPPTLRGLASTVGTNKNKLAQLFQERYGVTPQVFCLQRRIERAQILLTEGRLNVGQIADEVGYQHQSSFTVAFGEVVGMSPREFARRFRMGEAVVAPVH